MKRPAVLIVSYNWPPRNAIGSHRPYSWAKYWSASGVDVTVLTATKYALDGPLDLNLPVLDGVEVIEIPYLPGGKRAADTETGRPVVERRGYNLVSRLRRVKNALASFSGLSFDVRDRWVSGARKSLHELCANRQFDAVVSTYGPRACHLIASDISKMQCRPVWIADYRDLWSQNHLSGLKGLALRREQRKELESVGSFATAITTVSEDLALSLRSLHNKVVHVIANGFDLSLDQLRSNLASRSGPRMSGMVRVVYTGMIYPGRRDPSPLFVAINELLAEGRISPKDVAVDFFGGRQEGLVRLVHEHNANSYVTLHGHVQRDIALGAQVAANLLLLLESGEPDANGVLTGKLFEYMGSGAPILSLGSSPKSEIALALRRCGVGIAVGDDVQKVKDIIISIVEGGAPGWFHPEVPALMEYTREHQADKLLGVIRELVSNAETV